MSINAYIVKELEFNKDFDNSDDNQDSDLIKKHKNQHLERNIKFEEMLCEKWAQYKDNTGCVYISNIPHESETLNQFIENIDQPLRLLKITISQIFYPVSFYKMNVDIGYYLKSITMAMRYVKNAVILHNFDIDL